MSDVITMLAQEVVDLDRRRADVLIRLRAELISNGEAKPNGANHGAEVAAPATPFPATAASPRASPKPNGRGGAPSGSTRGKMLANAVIAQDRIVELLKRNGGPISTASIAKSMTAPKGTTAERLQKLRASGRVFRHGARGGWSATPAPSASEATPA